MKTWIKKSAARQKREFDQGETSVYESAENIAILDKLVNEPQRKANIARGIRILGLNRWHSKS